MTVDVGVRELGRRTVLRTSLAYGLMVVAAVAAFFFIRGLGEGLSAPPPAAADAAAAAGAAPGHALRHLLLVLAIVIALAQVLSRLFAYLHQPPVIGEVVAGILLGPSLLGTEISQWILPASVAPYLSVVAQLGVILYMFLVGLELNPSLLRHRAHATVAISHASITVPFVLGALLALFLYPRLSTSDVPFTSFALFLGVAMSITAFPVLARILTDRGLQRSELGVTAIACAAIGDVTAWCLLALVVGVAQAQVGNGLLVFAGAIAFIAVMRLARPHLARLADRWPDERLPRPAVALVFLAILLSALATEMIGIHAIFGAFLLGAMIPHESAVARAFTRQLENVVTICLLPAFFAFTGMRTEIGLLSSPGHWAICGVIVLVATVGKFGGTFVAARLTGVPARGAAALGTLMNTRGLMELIVLSVGLDLKVISPTLFAMMVLMALATTMATSPILRALLPATKSLAAPAPEANGG